MPAVKDAPVHYRSLDAKCDQNTFIATFCFALVNNTSLVWLSVRLTHVLIVLSLASWVCGSQIS